MLIPANLHCKPSFSLMSSQRRLEPERCARGPHAPLTFPTEEGTWPTLGVRIASIPAKKEKRSTVHSARAAPQPTLQATRSTQWIRGEYEALKPTVSAQPYASQIQTLMALRWPGSVMGLGERRKESPVVALGQPLFWTPDSTGGEGAWLARLVVPCLYR